MTLENAYARLGGSYEAVRGRLKNDRLIRMFLEEFLEDEEFENLKRALAQEDGPIAFRAAHTLKGVCMNLELGILGEASSALTENLRHNPINAQTKLLFEKVEKAYTEACAIISLLLKES